MLDFTPLRATHLAWGGMSFAIVWFWVKIALSRRPPALRAHPSHRAYFAGVVLVTVTTLTSALLLEGIGLRLSLIGAAILILIIGTLDEVSPLSPARQLAGQIIIALLPVAAGWIIPHVMNPFGDGVVPITYGGGVLTVLWLLFLMNSVNWLDGADGLATGVGTIALVTLAAVSLLPATQDPLTLSLALTGAGGSFAYLIWNWPPARIYLGTSGSWFLGLYIGLVAIIGGGKIATTLLVLAIPTLDVLLVIVQRLLAGQRPWRGDTTRHLHHRLQARGTSPVLLAALALLVTAVLGLGAVMLQTRHKLLTVIAVAAMLSATSLRLWRQQKSASSD
ncbi:MAG TPA: MraY family glycosyltransferase [Candidatus Andersenbacteria bacterium]|nr:MraY family glycosyltransferase [Candidatus Andersenbacteria bacterium]